MRSASPHGLGHGARLAPTEAHARAADARRRAEPAPGPDARPEPPAPALFEDYAAFARAARRAAAAVGTRAAPGERRDAVADVCWRACADAVARRVPPPRTLAVAWVPQLIQELGASTRVEARALRRAVRARCVRPPLQRATTETLPARSPTRTSSADEARRKLRDAELQVLLRVTLSADARRLQDRDFRAVRAIVEHASFALNAPHVRCEPPRRARPADDADYHVDYASLPSFVATALQPPLSTLAPEVLDRLAAALELASQDEPPPPPRRRPRQNDDGAWPAPARSMLPPAKRPRLERRASSSGGAPSGGSGAAFCRRRPPRSAGRQRRRRRRPRRRPPRRRRARARAARRRRRRGRRSRSRAAHARPPPPPPAAPPPVRAPLRARLARPRGVAAAARRVDAAPRPRLARRRRPPRAARRRAPRLGGTRAGARAVAGGPRPADARRRGLAVAAAPTRRARARAGRRRRGGSAAARRSARRARPRPRPRRRRVRSSRRDYRRDAAMFELAGERGRGRGRRGAARGPSRAARSASRAAGLLTARRSFLRVSLRYITRTVPVNCNLRSPDAPTDLSMQKHSGRWCMRAQGRGRDGADGRESSGVNDSRLTTSSTGRGCCSAP